jgi:ABC-type branched-subunit amino acid transport system ATPase component/ABC-type branched-subunit amino acid transport system permease subunit
MRGLLTSRGLALVGIALLAAAPFVMTPFAITLLNGIGLSALVVLGLVLLTGVAGLTSFGQAAFAGLGAYATAALGAGVIALPAWLAWMGGSPWAGLFAGLLLTSFCAFLLGALSLRLSGHYLPLSTIAWGLSLYYLFGTLESMGGQSGLPGIPAITILGVSLADERKMYLLVWLTVVLAAWALHNLLDSRAGRAIRALKGGMVMAEAMGIDTARTRLTAFMLAAWLASVSGWLYAHSQRFVNPTPFGVQAGIDYLFMAVLGGAGQVWGALLGAGLVVALREWLDSALGALLGRGGNFQTIAFGLVLVLMLQRWREGLWPMLAQRWQGLAAFTRQAVRVPAPAQVARLPRKPMPKRGEVVLEARGVTRRFGGLVANNRMNLTIRAGEILALVGPNGAGKSTMFNQISGVDTPNEGQVKFRGVSVAGKGARQIAALGLSRTFQHVRLLPRMSVLENVALGTHMRGSCGVLASALRLDRAQEAQLLAEAAVQLERVGLAERMHDAAGSLSLGQQRTLEIARALASDPCLLLLDEPAAGLRLGEKQMLGRLLRQLREEGMAILLVEHDMDFVMELVDRMVVMDFGQKIAEGLPQEIQCNPAVLEAYLGGVSDEE